MQKEYLAGYKDQLLRLSDNENLSRALSETDLSQFSNLQELYEHLLSGAETYGYTADDVNRLFARLAQREELNELVNNLTEIATGDLKTVLEGLDMEAEGIDNPVRLIAYLMDQSENYEYTREDAMNLLLDYLEKEDLKEIIKLLIGTSSGDLLNLLLSLDTQQNNIRNLDDLYTYLIEQARYHDYTENDVVRMFLNLLKILEYEPIVEEVPRPDITEEEKEGKGWLFYVLGGIAMIIVILLFARRRKPARDAGKESGENAGEV
jgi:hypothetical protein